MCGIAGLYSFKKFKDRNKIKKLATALLLDIETRGRNATGISLIDSESDEIGVYKKDIDASDFVKTKLFHKIFKNITDYNIILLHTRQATHGDAKDSNNNHPHFSKKFNNVLIHNGIITNYTTLKDKHKDIKLDGECDSEIILSLFNKYKHNIKTTLKQLRGNLATALYHKHKLYLYANDNPLNICYNKTQNLFLFSSYRSIFKDLFEEEDGEKEYELFNFYNKKNKYSVYKCEDEDLIKVFFKSKKIIKDTAEINDDYTYNSTSWRVYNNDNSQPTEKEKADALSIEKELLKENHNNIKIINEGEHTQRFIENDLKESEKEILCNMNLAKKDELIQAQNYDDEVDYLSNEEYKQALDEEDAERERRHNNRIHTKPLPNFDAYGSY